MLHADLSWVAVQGIPDSRSSPGENVLFIATTDYLHAGEGYYDQPPRGMHLHEFIRRRDAPVLAAIENCSAEELIRASGQTGMLLVLHIW